MSFYFMGLGAVLLILHMGKIHFVSPVCIFSFLVLWWCSQSTPNEAESLCVGGLQRGILHLIFQGNDSLAPQLPKRRWGSQDCDMLSIPSDLLDCLVAGAVRHVLFYKKHETHSCRVTLLSASLKLKLKLIWFR